MHSLSGVGFNQPLGLTIVVKSFTQLGHTALQGIGETIVLPQT